MSNNPYVEKFSKSFNTGLAVVIFLTLVIVASCMPEPAHAATSGDLPVTCLTAEEFTSEYQSGSFEITNKSSVIIFVETKPYRIDKIITRGLESGDTIEGTWLVENSGKFCLLFMQNLGKIREL